MARDEDPTRDEVTTTVTLVIRGIPKEDRVERGARLWGAVAVVLG
jgi:hypothetical protein